MTYRKPHPCDENNCQSYSAYIRVKKKWTKAGEFNSKCRTFTPNDNVKTYDDIKQDEFEKFLADRLPDLKRMVGMKV